MRRTALKALRRLEGDAVDSGVVRGQYGPGWIDGKEVGGYREEPDVHPDSAVETYVAAELRVDKKLAKKLKLGKSRVLARGKKTLGSAGNAKVTLKVVRKARKRFKKLRKARVTLKTATKMGGVTTRTSRVLKLKR